MKNIDKDNDSSLVLAAYIIVGIIVIALIIMACCFFFGNNKQNQVIHVDTMSGGDNYLEDDNYMNELNALAISLAMPEDVLHRSFSSTWYYVGGILQSDNQQLGLNSVTFDRQVLEKLLNDVDFWIMESDEFGTYEDYTAEQTEARTTTEDSISEYIGDSFESGYQAYIARERMENFPNLMNKLFYDNQVVYIFKSTYYKYIVSFNIDDNGKVTDYKVITGQ